MTWNTIFSKIGIPPGRGDDIIIYLFVISTIVLVTFIVRGIIRKDRKWKFAAIGFFLGFFICLLLYLLAYITKLSISYLFILDILAFVYCLGICNSLFGLPYIFTLPFSLGIYGIIIGYLVGKYKKI